MLIWIVPSRNSRKYYIQDGYYHVYNRGVEKRNIFQDQQDYNVFLNYLSEYLLPKDRYLLMSIIADPRTDAVQKDQAAKLLRLNNFKDQIQMIAFALMPNHFHFLIKQKDRVAVDQFMNSLATRYTMYFNRKNERVGHLYQGVYKAIEVETDEYLLHLSRYIHKQALMFNGSTQPSSYEDFIGTAHYNWVQPQDVLNFFSANSSISYQEFMDQEENLRLIDNLLLEG